MVELVPLYEVEESSSSLHHVRTQESRKRERGPSPKTSHAGNLMSDFPASRTVRKNVCVEAIRLWYFILAA